MSMQKLHFHFIYVGGRFVGPGFGFWIKIGLDSVKEKSFFVADFVEIFDDFVELESFRTVKFENVTWGVWVFCDSDDGFG